MLIYAITVGLNWKNHYKKYKNKRFELGLLCAVIIITVNLLLISFHFRYQYKSYSCYLLWLSSSSPPPPSGTWHPSRKQSLISFIHQIGNFRTWHRDNRAYIRMMDVNRDVQRYQTLNMYQVYMSEGRGINELSPIMIIWLFKNPRNICHKERLVLLSPFSSSS